MKIKKFESECYCSSFSPTAQRGRRANSQHITKADSTEAEESAASTPEKQTTEAEEPAASTAEKQAAQAEEPVQQRSRQQR